jgi:anti-sigma B factor antagonist
VAAPTQTGFTINQQISGRRGWIAVSGELDIATTPELADAVENALIAAVRDLTIDLCSTTFIDSSGINVLLQAARGTPRLTVVCAPGPVRRVLDISGAASVLTLQSA